jgi:hypothetical protein
MGIQQANKRRVPELNPEKRTDVFSELAPELASIGTRTMQNSLKVRTWTGKSESKLIDPVNPVRQNDAGRSLRPSEAKEGRILWTRVPPLRDDSVDLVLNPVPILFCGKTT